MNLPDDDELSDYITRVGWRVLWNVYKWPLILMGGFFFVALVSLVFLMVSCAILSFILGH